VTNFARSDRPRRLGPEVVAVEGLSGAGKTTVVRALSKVPGIHVVAEAYDRFPRRPSLEFAHRDELLALESRLLAEDARRYVESRRPRRSPSTVVTDTDFLGTLTYGYGLATEIDARWDVLAPLVQTARSELEKGRWGLADRYIYLDVPPHQALARAARTPRTHPEEFRDRHDQVGRAEREFYLRRLPLLLKHRVEVVRGVGPVVEIADEIRERLHRPAAPATSEEAEKVLAWFERSSGAWSSPGRSRNAAPRSR
jgi:thymidylate kinase